MITPATGEPPVFRLDSLCPTCFAIAPTLILKNLWAVYLRCRVCGFRWTINLETLTPVYA